MISSRRKYGHVYSNYVDDDYESVHVVSEYVYDYSLILWFLRLRPAPRPVSICMIIPVLVCIRLPMPVLLRVVRLTRVFMLGQAMPLQVGQVRLNEGRSGLARSRQVRPCWGLSD